MFRSMLKSKIHRAVVTEANLEYVGSLTIPADLMEAVGLVAHEHIHVANVNTGARFETYVIEGPAGSRAFCVNGAAARLAEPGDRIIVLSYAFVPEADVPGWTPRVAILDEANRLVDALAAT